MRETEDAWHMNEPAKRSSTNYIMESTLVPTLPMMLLFYANLFLYSVKSIVYWHKLAQ